MWLPRACSVTSGAGDDFEDDGAGVSTPVATLVSMHSADLAPCLSLDKMQHESPQPCLGTEACSDQQDQQQQQPCQAQLPAIVQAGNCVLQPSDSFHDGNVEQAGAATGPGLCAASNGTWAAAAVPDFSFTLALQPQASPTCSSPALIAVAPSCGGAATGTAAADPVLQISKEDSRVQQALTSATYGCGGSSTDSAAPELAAAAVNMCSQPEGAPAAGSQVATSTPSASGHPIGVTEDLAHACSAAGSQCQAAEDLNATAGGLPVAAGGAGSAAGVFAGAAGAAGDAEVAELRLRLASVEASRDELARQQGQYKGLIARVSVCLVVAVLRHYVLLRWVC